MKALFISLGVLGLIMLIGFYGYSVYSSSYLLAKSKQAEAMMKLDYKIFSDLKNRFSFKYPKNYQVKVDGDNFYFYSTSLDESLNDIKKNDPTQYGEVVIPKIYLKVLSELPNPKMQNNFMEDLKIEKIGNYEVYTGSIEPGIFIDKNYFIKLNDGSYLFLSVYPYFDNSSEILNTASAQYDKAVKDIILNLELK